MWRGQAFYRSATNLVVVRGGGCVRRKLPRAHVGCRTAAASTISSSSDDYYHQRDSRQQAGRTRNTARQNRKTNTNNQRLLRPDVLALQELAQELRNLRQSVVELGFDRPAPVWQQISTCSKQDVQNGVFQQAIAAVVRLRAHLEARTLRPDGKHRQEFSVIVERILRVYACCCHEQSEIFPQVQQLLDWMKHFQLEISHEHCDAALHVAAREGRWAEAADLYSNQIDPDRGGYVPVTSTAPVVTGLYCMAKAALEAGSLPVESVFDGVLKLTMLSPTDSEKYVLAAGVALGQAGQGEALRDYLQSSYKANKLGQPLVAAAMHACVLCGRHQEALAIYDDLVQGELAAASEWQWGGGADRLHPACRDLAMRAMGGLDAEDADAFPNRALKLFAEAEAEYASFSVEAASGLVSVLSKADHWEDIANLFLSIIDKPLTTFVRGDDLVITVADVDPQYPPALIISELGRVMDQVMKAFNSVGKHGLALLCLRLFDVAMVSPVASPYTKLVDTDATTQHSKIVQSMLPIICSMGNARDVLNSTMVSLCGVGAPHEATSLFDATFAVLSKDANNPIAREEYDVYRYASSLKQSTDPTLLNRFDPVHRHINRLTACLSTIEKSEQRLSFDDARMLSCALATTIRECVASSYPETGTVLGNWAERRRLHSATTNSPALFSTDSERLTPPLHLTDSLLAAAIEAYGACGKIDIAQYLIQSNLGDNMSPADWLPSYHEAVKSLFAQGQSDDAMALFRSVLAVTRSPTFFCGAAQNLKASGNWREVIELYRLALTSGCLSKELCMLAMEAVAASGRIGQNKRQFPLLRSIIGEIAKLSGVSPSEWLEHNYWSLRKVLGYSLSRLIMGWDDYETSRLDELELAIENLEKRSAEGLTPKRSVLFVLVKSVANFEKLQVPFNRTGLPKVPRDKEAWSKVLDKVLVEAESTPLFYEPRFIDEVAAACLRIGRYEECVDRVNQAISKGLRLHKAALQNAEQAAKEAGREELTSDIRMLLAGDSELK